MGSPFSNFVYPSGNVILSSPMPMCGLLSPQAPPFGNEKDICQKRELLTTAGCCSSRSKHGGREVNKAVNM